MRLIWTNDRLVASMIVVKMLKVENQFEEITTPKEFSDWKFIPHDHVMRAKRHFYSLPALVDIRLTDETFNKLTQTSVGLCPMLFEGMMFYLGMRDLLSTELGDGYNRMEEKVKTSGCRQNILHQMWDEPGWETIGSVNDIKVLNEDLGHVSEAQKRDMKSAIGYILGTVSGPNYFFQYGTKKP